MKPSMGQPKKDFDAAVIMYEGGLSTGEVAAVFGITRQSMWAALRLRGVKIRPQKRFGSDNTFHRGGKTNGKEQARRAMKLAMRNGIIKRGTVCEECGGIDNVQGHHDDYNALLTVRWLCKPCHFAWHKDNKAIPLRG